MCGYVNKVPVTPDILSENGARAVGGIAEISKVRETARTVNSVGVQATFGATLSGVTEVSYYNEVGASTAASAASASTALN